MSDHKKREILRSVTTKTATEVHCKVTKYCNYSLPVDRFVVGTFCQHIKSNHGNAYKPLFHGTRTGRNKKNLLDQLMSCIKRNELEGGFQCEETLDCSYLQPYDRFNEKAFARHLAYYHPDTYKDLEIDYYLKMQRKPKPAEPEAKVKVEVNRYKFLTTMFKLITSTGLKFSAFKSLVMIIGANMDGLDMLMDDEKAREHMSSLTKRIQRSIEDEIDGRMIALQLHGKSCTDRYEYQQCEIRVTCTYLQDNCSLAKRLLGVIKLSDEKHLQKDLEKIKLEYCIESWQIHTVTVDYGIVTLDSDLKDEELFNLIPPWRRPIDDSEIKDTMEQFAASLSSDGKLLPCLRHVISAMATDAIQDYEDSTIREIAVIAAKFRKSDHRDVFEGQRFPPKPDRKNMGIGTYLMLRVLKEKRSFYEKFIADNPVYALQQYWEFIEEFVAAFEPLYHCAVHVGGECPLSDFHLQWMIAYGKINSLPETNRFRGKLLAAMDARKKSFEDSVRYQAALYMDPRFNFKGSTLFDAAKKEKIVVYTTEEYRTEEDFSEDDEDCSMASETTQEDPPTTTPKGDFNVDDYLTEKFVKPSVAEPSMKQVIREIQNQDRCSATDPDFNIVKYWCQKKIIEPRLWTLAKTVLAPIATTCSERIEQDEYYRTDGLYDKDGDGYDSEDDSSDEYETRKYNDKWNALFIKKNHSFLNRAIAEEFDVEPDKSDSDECED